ncbi:MAG TPA: RNA polymerase sigma factor [Gemmatimonadaceae bacterium]
MNARSLPLIGIPEPNAAPTTAPADLRAALERHHAESMGWAMACCGFDRSEASDVLQDAYLKVLDGRAVFRGESSFRTWLFGVVRRTAAEHRRNVFRRLSTMWRVLPDDVAADTPDPHDTMDGRAIADRLRAALRILPAKQRQVLYLVFNEELTVEAAAGVMGISVGSARTHYARGKARVREFLQGRRP